MEIEVGDYIRDKEGNITKIQNLLNLDREVYLYLGEDGYQYSDNAIKSHSKNIIDLVEVGDYVNGKYVKEIKQYKDGKSIIALIGIIDEKDIKSIVTHEQFESIECKVEEDK